MNESLAELNKDQPAENPSGLESSAFGSSQVQSSYTPPVAYRAATVSGQSPSEEARRAEAKAAAEKARALRLAEDRRMKREELKEAVVESFAPAMEYLPVLFILIPVGGVLLGITYNSKVPAFVGLGVSAVIIFLVVSFVMLMGARKSE